MHWIELCRLFSAPHRVREKNEPCHRVTADAASALSDVGPFDVFPQAQEGSSGALVCTFGQHDVVPFGKFEMLSDADDVRAPFRHFIQVPPGYGRNRGLLTSLAFSSLAFAASCSLAARAASL